MYTPYLIFLAKAQVITIIFLQLPSDRPSSAAYLKFLLAKLRRSKSR